MGIFSRSESVPAESVPAESVPAESAPAVPAESVPAESAPAVPAESAPAVPAESAPAVPAESAPAESAPAAPAESAPAAPAESVQTLEARLAAVESLLRARDIEDAVQAAGLPSSARDVVSRMSGDPAVNAALLKSLVGSTPPAQTKPHTQAGYGLFDLGR